MTETTIDESVLTALEGLNNEDFAAIIVFLANKKTQGNNLYENILKNYASNPKRLLAVGRQMAQDARKSNEDDSYARVMENLWKNYLSDGCLPTEHQIHLLSITKAEEIAGKGHVYQTALSVLRSMERLSPSAQARIIREVSKVANVSKGTMTKYVGAAQRSIVKVGLIAAHITYELFVWCQKWYRGECSGKFAAKKVTDILAASIVGGFAGGELGSIIGSVVMPGAGTIVGAIAGSFIGYTVVANISNWVTCKIFGVPQTEALDNAYRFLGVPHDAPNSEVNTAYRKAALKYHPDKNDSAQVKEKWHQLQIYMTIIRLDRDKDASWSLSGRFA